MYWNLKNAFALTTLALLGTVANAQTYVFDSYIGNGYGTGDGQFHLPYGVAVDGSGNLFVADEDNSRIEKFDSSGSFVQTIGSYGIGNGQFIGPNGISVDSSGNIFVADNVTI